MKEQPKEQSFVSEKQLKEDYELSEKYSKRCQESFKQEYSNGEIGSGNDTLHCNYQNHFNKKLNKCFILISCINPNKNGILTMINLWDINERKEYGSFVKLSSNSTPTDCRSLDRYCHSEGEWDSLVKPYMEE